MHSFLLRWQNRVQRFLELFYHHRRVIIYTVDRDWSRPARLSDFQASREEGSKIPAPVEKAMRKTGSWDKAQIAERRLRKDLCHYVLEDGECVHYAWSSRSTLEATEVSFRVSLPANHLWIYNCQTMPSHRGKGIYPLVLNQMVDDFFKLGGQVVCIGILDNNNSSSRGVTKAGFEKTIAIERTTLFSLFTTCHVVPLTESHASSIVPSAKKAIALRWLYQLSHSTNQF